MKAMNGIPLVIYQGPESFETSPAISRSLVHMFDDFWQGKSSERERTGRLLDRFEINELLSDTE